MDFRATPDAPNWDEVGTSHGDELIMVTQNWDEISSFYVELRGNCSLGQAVEPGKAPNRIIQSEIQEYYWDFKVSC